jgi:plasmid stability protein
MQARAGYNAGMQYTIRNIPNRVDKALRAEASRRGTSLNEAARTALARGLGLDGDHLPKRDLTGIAGSWKPDPKFDQVIREFDRVDDEDWR